MRVTLVVPPAIADQLVDIAAQPVEVGGVLLARYVEAGDQARLLAREFLPVDPAHYELQAVDELVVRSEGYVPALRRAEERGEVAIWVHTHPGVGSMPVASTHDLRVDRELSEVFRIRTGHRFYGALILSPGNGGFRFTGHLADEDGRFPIERAWLVGDRFHLIPAADMPISLPRAEFDRNVRAFGSGIQRALGELKVGVVGCGGTGSAVVEQLARLGVRDFVLLDPKALTSSNVTRVYGTGEADIGVEKATLAHENVVRVAPGAQVETYVGELKSPDIVRRFAGCDVVFGCTDDEAGRVVISRFSTYLMCPVIDCGVLISSGEHGVLEGIDGRVTVLAPGTACLVCRRRIDMQLAAAQFLPESERTQRQAEGYAPALAGVEPAVVTFTTSVAAAAVNELLERMIEFGPTPRPSEVLLRFHEREISTNRALPRERHYCHLDSGKLGAGLTEPLFDMSWPT